MTAILSKQNFTNKNSSKLSIIDFRTVCKSLNASKSSKGMIGNIIYKIKCEIRNNSKSLLRDYELKLIINSLLDYELPEKAIDIFYQIKKLNY